MKFSEFDGERWGELQPYFDTCVLPVTGLSGSESPAEATAALERLRDLLELVEIPYKGRTVTYPAMHYTADDPEAVERTVGKLREAGFKYAIVVALAAGARRAESGADLWVLPEENGELPDAKAVSEAVQAMWRRPSADA